MLIIVHDLRSNKETLDLTKDEHHLILAENISNILDELSDVGIAQRVV